MGDFTAEDRKKMEETHDVVIKLNTVLLGADGDEGLVGQVNQNTKSIQRLNGNVKWIVGILIGAGVITGTTIGIINLG